MPLDLNFVIAALIGFIIGFLVELGLEVWYFRGPRTRHRDQDREEVDAALRASRERVEQLEATLQAKDARIGDLEGRLEGAQIRMNALQGEIAQRFQTQEGGRIVEPIPSRGPAVAAESATDDDVTSSEG